MRNISTLTRAHYSGDGTATVSVELITWRRVHDQKLIIIMSEISGSARIIAEEL